MTLWACDRKLHGDQNRGRKGAGFLWGSSPAGKARMAFLQKPQLSRDVNELQSCQVPKGWGKSPLHTERTQPVSRAGRRLIVEEMGLGWLCPNRRGKVVGMEQDFGLQKTRQAVRVSVHMGHGDTGGQCCKPAATHAD